jgi:hypothetical protein
MLPDPVPEMSCDHSPLNGAPSLFHVFKGAFRHGELPTGSPELKIGQLQILQPTFPLPLVMK